MLSHVDLKMNHPKIIQDYMIKELEKRLEINLTGIPQFNHMKYINLSKYTEFNKISGNIRNFYNFK